MDESWHHHQPPPPGGGAPPYATVCPACSISHFPFCPSSFYPNHQFPPPPHPDQFYPRPPPPPPAAPAPPPPPPPAAEATPYNPFVDHRSGPVPNPHRPPGEPWSTSSEFDRDPYGNMYHGFDYDNVGAKRMRFDDSGFSSGPTGPYSNENFGYSPHISADNERRLKLIRDHGGSLNQGIDRKFEEQRKNFDGRIDVGFKPSGDLRNLRYGNFDRKETESSLNVHNGEEQFGLENRKRDRNVEQELWYNQVDKKMDQSNVNRYNGNPTDSYNTWQGVSGVNAVYNDHQSGFAVGNHDLHNQFLQKYAMQHHVEPKLNQYGSPFSNNQGGSLQNQSGFSMGLAKDSRLFNGQPPLPASPPPPLPVEPPGRLLSEPRVSPSPSRPSASLFPIPVASSTVSQPSYPLLPEASSLASAYYPNKGHLHTSTSFGSEEFQAIRQVPSSTYLTGSKAIPFRPLSPEKPKTIDACHIIRSPYRATRPDHIVIILRGLPGSGKSYLAKMLRDLEVENGGSVPRIHSMDDYFMTEVEKVEDIEVSKSSGSVRGKRQVSKKVIEFCYEPEMEEAYRSSMLKAFKKTLDEGVFSFVIVDDRNLRVADFAQFWATAKRSGYEVYLLEAAYKDPAGCAARNVHGFTQDNIQKMADLWEEAPSLYLKLDIKSLLHGDGSAESGIQEVDMDLEDGEPEGDLSGSEERNTEKPVVRHEGDPVSDGPAKDDQRWDADCPIEEVKELRKSKWSNDLDEGDIRKNEASKGNLNALPGLLQSYQKEGKSVRWGDEIGKSGFSIAAAKAVSVFSLVIGPGAGYNLKSNPLPEEEKMRAHNKGGSKKQNVFQERLRAERESFRAVFDKRRQRIGGLYGDDD